MGILTESELWALVPDADNMESAQAIEAAILAKLASAELPNPVMLMLPNQPETGVYTADQLRQAYAQGAASQLSQEPFTHYRHYDEQVQPFADEGTIPLFTRKEPK